MWQHNRAVGNYTSGTAQSAAEAEQNVLIVLQVFDQKSKCWKQLRCDHGARYAKVNPIHPEDANISLASGIIYLSFCNTGLLCTLVVQQRILLYLLPDGIRAKEGCYITILTQRCT